MDYKAVRDRIEDMANNNHRDFVKVIISIEKGSSITLIWTMTALI